MGPHSCVIRNYRSADLDEYVRLHAQAESVCRSDDSFLLASLTGESSTPFEFSEKDLFLAEEQGKIAGACRMVPELAIERAVLRLLIRLGYLGGGVAAGLVGAALERAAYLEVQVVHADLREEDQAARDLFAGLGFTPVRMYTDMELELDPAPLEEPEHEGLSTRALEQGGAEELTELQNLAFGGSWGFCPNTTDQIVQQLGLPGYGHDGVILAYRGEKAVGYCWTGQLRPPDHSGAALGHIHMMGVVPEFRGRGLSRYILLSGLRHLAGKDIQTRRADRGQR